MGSTIDIPKKFSEGFEFLLKNFIEEDKSNAVKSSHWHLYATQTTIIPNEDCSSVDLLGVGFGDYRRNSIGNAILNIPVYFILQRYIKTLPEPLKLALHKTVSANKRVISFDKCGWSDSDEIIFDEICDWYTKYPISRPPFLQKADGLFGID